MSLSSQDNIAALDSQIAEAAEAASTLASTAKSLRARLRDLLVGNGLSKQARDLQAKLADTSNEQALAEELRATLAERRAQLAADKAAKEAAAEKKARIDTFKAFLAERTEAAERAEAAIAQLASALEVLTNATARLREALPSVGLPGNAVGMREVQPGLRASLWAAGVRCLDEPPHGLDDSGHAKSVRIGERIAANTAYVLAKLPEA
jgi:hypothetical protein